MTDPREIHDRVAQETNMTPDQLRRMKDTREWEAYGEAKSGGEDLNEPVNDMIRLLETPADEYEDKDDGFNEVEEGQQAISFLERMKSVEPGEPVGDTGISKRDFSLYGWGYDPDQNDGFMD
jgi:hypothetical protein